MPSDNRKKANKAAKTIASWTEIDLTENADQLRSAYAADAKLQELGDLLQLERSVLLSGESGVGKTALVHELAKRCAAGKGPENLRGVRIIQISLQRRQIAIGPKKHLGTPLQELIEAIAVSDEPIMIFLRDADVAARFCLGAQLDALAFNASYPVIAEGSNSGIAELLEDDPELYQSFSSMHIAEPSLENAQKIGLAWAYAQEAATGIKFDKSAITEAVYLTHRFIGRDKHPRKSLDLLEQTRARVQSSEGTQLTINDVLNRFCALHRTPRWLVDAKMTVDISALERRFTQRVLGQPEAVSAVVGTVGMLKAGLSDMRRSFGVFLFVGPTGVGKTHVAQLLAEQLFGSSDRMIRLNMADFGDPGGAARLLGDPNAFDHAIKRGVLTQRIMGHPFAVILLDELEKAHGSVHDGLLQLFDEGSFINGLGETIACRSSIIIATSNAGAEAYRRIGFGFRPAADTELLHCEIAQALDQYFRFEFLNRFDRVVHFRPLTRSQVRSIALRELKLLSDRPGMLQRNLKLEIDDSVLDWLAAHGFDPEYGARFMRRTIEREVTATLADAIVRDQPRNGGTLRLAVRRDRIAASVTEPEPRTSPKATKTKHETLSSKQAQQLATELLPPAQTRLEQHASAVERRSELLIQTQSEGFWDSKERGAVVDEFRELETHIQVCSQLVRPLQDLIAGPSQTGANTNWPKIVSTAATALDEWSEREAGTGPSAVWLIISEVDPLVPGRDWIERLATLELVWLGRLGYTSQVAAWIDGDDSSPHRLAIQVEGPGCANVLAMEIGLHVLRRRRNADQRARVDIVPIDSSATEETNTDDPQYSAMATKRRQGPLDLEIQRCVTLELSRAGISTQVLGADGPTLTQLASDLQHHHLQSDDNESTTAREYSEDGSVYDPRSDLRLTKRDATRGRYERLQAAYRKLHRSVRP